MKKGLSKKLSILLVVLLTTVTMTDVATSKASAKNLDHSTVYLKGLTVKSHETVKLPKGLMKKAYSEKEVGPYIISFKGPIENSMKNGVEALGAELNDYLPDFSFLAIMTPEIANKVSELSYVEDVMIFQPAYKINSKLKDNSGNIKELGESNFRIITFDDKVSLDKEIANMGGTKLSQSKNKITAKLNKGHLEKLANMNSVKYIEAVPEYVLMNDKATSIMNVKDMESIGYTGAGQVVGIADTGLDTGKNDSTMHKDFQGRINSIISLGRENDASDPNGHGTHVAGSVLGNGAQSNGQLKGSAPGANLVFQSVLDANGYLTGIPYDMSNLFDQSWNAGARIHTNSWGSAAGGEYTLDSQDVDDYLWNNDMIVLFAAGNEGDDSAGNYPFYSTIGSPGTAKNCITVGASENNRPDMPITKWGNVGDNINQIAPFSSRGYCTDGRVKPDIVAPGTWILSTKSSLAPDANCWKPYNEYYCYMGGTSMSTPLTAGAVAVAREYMQKNWNLTPSPAMMKAALVNGGVDLGFGFPSRDQGWGSVSLTNSLTSKEYKFDDETSTLITGGNKSYSYSVESSATPLKISLVWTDYAGTTIAAKALVNDLDLKITSPNGTVYYGNDFALPFNTSFDRINNVENILINTPEVGDYKVEVIGYNVPKGPQPYALFSSGNFGTPGSDTTAPTCNITSPTNNQTVNSTVSINATATDNVGVIKVEFYVDGAKVSEDNSSPYSTTWDTTTLGNNTTHILSVKAYDAAGNIGTSSTVTVTVVNTAAPDTTAPTCRITSPINNQTVKGTVDIQATANDNVGVSKVEFYVDGAKVSEDTTASYNYLWDTTTLTYGAHTLSVKAYDAAGNIGTSVIVTVTVDNSVAVQYTTSKFSGKVSKNKPNEHTITVTAAGTITLTSNSSVIIELINSSGISVAKGTTSISYNATQIGTYKIKVTTTSSKSISYTLNAEYPIAALKVLTR